MLSKSLAILFFLIFLVSGLPNALSMIRSSGSTASVSMASFALPTLGQAAKVRGISLGGLVLSSGQVIVVYALLDLVGVTLLAAGAAYLAGYTRSLRAQLSRASVGVEDYTVEVTGFRASRRLRRACCACARPEERVCGVRAPLCCPCCFEAPITPAGLREHFVALADVFTLHSALAQRTAGGPPEVVTAGNELALLRLLRARTALLKRLALLESVADRIAGIREQGQPQPLTEVAVGAGGGGAGAAGGGGAGAASGGGAGAASGGSSDSAAAEAAAAAAAAAKLERRRLRAERRAARAGGSSGDAAGRLSGAAAAGRAAAIEPAPPEPVEDVFRGWRRTPSEVATAVVALSVASSDAAPPDSMAEEGGARGEGVASALVEPGLQAPSEAAGEAPAAAPAAAPRYKPLLLLRPRGATEEMLDGPLYVQPGLCQGCLCACAYARCGRRPACCRPRPRHQEVYERVEAVKGRLAVFDARLLAALQQLSAVEEAERASQEAEGGGAASASGGEQRGEAPAPAVATAAERPHAAFVTFRSPHTAAAIVRLYDLSDLEWCLRRGRAFVLPRAGWAPPGAGARARACCASGSPLAPVELGFRGLRLRVRRAPPPDTLLYENLPTAPGERCARRALTTLASAALLLLSFACLYGAAAANNLAKTLSAGVANASAPAACAGLQGIVALTWPPSASDWAPSWTPGSPQLAACPYGAFSGGELAALLGASAGGGGGLPHADALALPAALLSAGGLGVEALAVPAASLPARALPLGAWEAAGGGDWRGGEGCALLLQLRPPPESGWEALREGLADLPPSGEDARWGRYSFAPAGQLLRALSQGASEGALSEAAAAACLPAAAAANASLVAEAAQALRARLRAGNASALDAASLGALAAMLGPAPALLPAPAEAPISACFCQATFLSDPGGMLASLAGDARSALGLAARAPRAAAAAARARARALQGAPLSPPASPVAALPVISACARWLAGYLLFSSVLIFAIFLNQGVNAGLAACLKRVVDWERHATSTSRARSLLRRQVVLQVRGGEERGGGARSGSA